MSIDEPLRARRPRLAAAADVTGLVAAGVLAEALFAVLLSHQAFGALTSKLLAPAETLVLLAAATLALRRRRETWGRLAFPTRISVRRAAGLVVGGYVGMMCVNALLLFLVLPRLGAAAPNLANFAAVKSDVATYLFWLGVAWTTAAVGEELLFRGFIWSRLERMVEGRTGGAARPSALAVGVALTGQAALFGLAHAYQGPGGILATGGVGLVLGLVRLAARRNLAPGMALHALIDTVSLTAVFFGVVPKSL